MISNDRLSSDNLYHFKWDFNILKLILQYGFRHNMWSEKIPYKNSEQHNFIVCFCDIKIEDTAFHRACYGNNAIVLTKEWGKRNGVSPVRYIHETSPGMSSNYLKSRNKFREIRQQANDHHDTIIMDYMLFSLLLDQNKLTHDSLFQDLSANPSLELELQALEGQFHEFHEILRKAGVNKSLTKYLYTLYNRIADLHNELERRDSFMRIYTDDFQHPNLPAPIANKVLYDEKEWRSIKFSEKADAATATANKFLPTKYNLTFTDEDVIAILCESNDVKDEFEQFFATEQTLLDPTLSLDKLQLIDDFKEK